MAIETGLRVVIFEDKPDTIGVINEQLQQIGARVVGQATTLTQAYEVLRQLADNTIVADVILLDGNLDRESRTPAFTISLPIAADGVVLKEPSERHKAAERVKVRVDPYNYGIGMRDAFVIWDILHQVGIKAKIVGISRSPLREVGLDVDVDITKAHIHQLGERLLQIIDQK